MTTVHLTNDTIYEVNESDELTYGNVGVFVWAGQPDEFGHRKQPPLRFWVFGFVREVRTD